MIKIQSRMEKKYTFKYIEKCNMCGAHSSEFKILGKRLNTSQGKDPQNKLGISVTIQKCNNCSLIFPNPFPIPNDIQDHYGIPPENYWIGDYFKIDENYFRGGLEWIQRLGGKIEGSLALDIGAGLGHCMHALKNAGYDVYGIEPSIPFYERAISKMKIDPSRIVNQQIEDADFKEGMFDFITFGAVLEHLYDPNLCLEKSMKWLKPGGLMYIEVPSSDWLVNKIINLVYKIKGKDYVANLSPMHEPFHLYEFGIDSFLKNAENNGYEIADKEFYVGDTYLPKLLDPFIKPYMKRTNKGMQLALMLRKK